MWNDEGGDEYVNGFACIPFIVIGALAGGIVALVLSVGGIMFPVLMPWVVVPLIAGPACGLAYAIAVK